VTIHDLIHERYPEFYPFIDRKIYTAKFKSACEKADVVVAISEATKQDIIEFYKIDERKIKVIYQSCHPQFYLKNLTENKLSTNFNLPPQPRELGGAGSQYLLYVGTVNERKNLLGLVKAIEILDKSVRIPLVVIGDGGAYFRKVKAYIHEKGLGNEIIFLKNVLFSDFPLIYRNAKALILPSFQEGFGIPIIEALWSDCPVITSVGSCFPEAAGPDSIYINPYKPNEIATAIDKVLTNEVVRERMILRGYEYVQQFHEKTIGEQWMQLYKEL
jgi:glycosyltransferase involved in cell wall biosynthesis